MGTFESPRGRPLKFSGTAGIARCRRPGQFDGRFPVQQQRGRPRHDHEHRLDRHGRRRRHRHLRNGRDGTLNADPRTRRASGQRSTFTFSGGTTVTVADFEKPSAMRGHGHLHADGRHEYGIDGGNLFVGNDGTGTYTSSGANRRWACALHRRLTSDYRRRWRGGKSGTFTFNTGGGRRHRDPHDRCQDRHCRRVHGTASFHHGAAETTRRQTWPSSADRWWRAWHRLRSLGGNDPLARADRRQRRQRQVHAERRHRPDQRRRRSHHGRLRGGRRHVHAQERIAFKRR